jgi:hypothetical protein
LEIDNNAVERAIRGIAVGRTGSSSAVTRAARRLPCRGRLRAELPE